MFEKRIGSRAEVMHGVAQQTGGGLKKADLFLNSDGRIKSKDAVKAAKDRLKREGAAHFVKVFKPKKGGPFKAQPKQGTKAYEKKLAKFEKKQEKI